MMLIDNWRSSLKWFSVQAMIAVGAIQTTWLNLPEEMKQAVPDQYINYITIALIIFGVFGRVVSQGEKS